VPKGLRSFDADDRDFFLQLLPGPRDKDGLPESLRFWKNRIEARDDPTFTVGVIYGPSGCGKSSLMKAGLLPRLARRIIPVNIEATLEETETKLLNTLRRRVPGLPGDRDLTRSLAALRQGAGLRSDQKVLIVLDQFEQWLHARRGDRDTKLARALRQCDGDRVQAIVMVRDDFWMALTRFMSDLRIDILQGLNAAPVDLFDPIHARTVLTEFGRAYGRLPRGDEALSGDQESFLTQTIDGLAQDGRIIPVRLVLFADMVKGRTWSPATLKDVGGTQGVGVAFLEETFSSPTLRSHLKAAQGVLKALLPEGGTNIKGHMRSYEDLVAASGHATHPGELDNLLRTLDRDARLITPTDPKATETEVGERPSPTGQYYQLTHDYLVPSIRDWLTRKQRETRRGRAELRLAERAASWEAKPENRHLPSIFEWIRIRALTRRKDWTAPQRRMMRRAGRLHSLRAMALAALIALGTWGGMEFLHLHSADLVQALETAATADLPRIIERMAGYRRWVNPRLVRMLGETPPSHRAHLHARLALLPVDPSQVDPLYDRLIAASPADLGVLARSLEPYKARLAPKLWSELEKAGPGDLSVLPSAGALALYDREDARWSDLGGKVARALVALNPILAGSWLDTLRPARTQLTAPLDAIFRDPSRPEDERGLAAIILADYAADDPERLAELLMVLDPKSFARFFAVVERQAAGALPVFHAELAKSLAAPGKEAVTEQARDQLAQRQARAAVALVRLGHAGEVWHLLRHSPDPRLRSFIVNWLEPLGADPSPIIAALDRPDSSPRPAEGEEDAPRRGDRSGPPATRHPSPATQEVLFNPETSTWRALILALGTYGPDGLSPTERERLVARLLDLYEHDPDAGIHGAAEWTLRQWKQQEKLKDPDAALRKLAFKDRGDRRWYVNGQNQTFVLVEGPVKFGMGSPPSEPDRTNDLTLEQRTIDRRFAIATKEVSVAAYQAFVSSARQNQPFGVAQQYLDKYTSADGPMIRVTWYGAAAYCNWLSEREGILKDQWCYEPNEKREYAEGMKIKADAVKLEGYRLPTEAEWEYACRAGTITSRYYGLSIGLLGKYAWYLENSGQHAWPVGSLLPNDLGLFDMLGNVYEWCQERYHDESVQANDIVQKSERINDSPRLLRGGAFYYRAALIRSANLDWSAPSGLVPNGGFRLARTYN
jgi:eukaryotic-like serine/threonine-protein kinase